MRSFARFVCVVTALGASFAVAPSSSAELPCHSACHRQAHQCIVEQARAGLFACKLDCATGSAAGRASCYIGCRNRFRADRTGCGTQRASCLTACAQARLAGANADCIETCATELATCEQQVISEAHDGALSCADFPGRLGVECLYGCADAAKAAGVDCGNDFDDCVGGCGAESPSAP